MSVEFTAKRFRLFIFETLRFEAEIELIINNLLSARFEFGGGFQGVISDLNMFINQKTQ